MACEYGPMAFGADGVVTAWRTSGCLDNLAGTEAPGADPEPAHAAVHHGTNALEVRFEPASRHIVRVADISPDDRALPAEFATFCHG
jgi:hypothetical protein